MSLNFFRYAGQIPMVEVLGGYFVQGSHRFYDANNPITAANDAPPHWVRIGERNKSAFAVTLSHFLEQEVMQMMGVKVEGESLDTFEPSSLVLEELKDAYRKKLNRDLFPASKPMTCVNWYDANEIVKRASFIAKNVHGDDRPMILPLASQMEYLIRGGHNGVVDIREKMAIEGVDLDQFQSWAMYRYENFVTVDPHTASESMMAGSKIYDVSPESGLLDIVGSNTPLFAWRVYGTPNGRSCKMNPDGTLLKQAWYDEGETRPVERAWGHSPDMGVAELEEQRSRIVDQIEARRILTGEARSLAEIRNALLETETLHPLALSDAAGNAWCWTADDYIPDLNPKKLSLIEAAIMMVDSDMARVNIPKELRGGSCRSDSDSIRAAYRISVEPLSRDENFGLRGVVNL